MVAMAKRGPPEEFGPAATLASAYHPRDTAAVRLAMRDAGDQPAWAYRTVGNAVATLLENYDHALALIEESRSRDPESRGSLYSLALLHASAGRWNAATTVAREEDRVRRYMRTVGVLTPFMPVTREDLEAAYREVGGTATDGDSDAAREEPEDGAPEAVELARRAYIRGLLDLRFDDEDAALTEAAALDSLVRRGEPRDTATIALLARSVRATVAIRRGDARGALASLGRVDGPMRIEHTYDPVLNRQRERYLLGVLLLEAGRPEEARRWLEDGLDTGWEGTRIYRPMTYLRLGEVHERLDNREEARRHYTAFVHAWERADSGLQPYVDQARAALARLTIEG